ncbi:MAG: NADH-quinone oxidoreductase subunit A [Deltaproteobacteria bacterium]|nr:NADH-quinone oxidoreductase subunit A [Deltaproteobacteria bacterium]
MNDSDLINFMYILLFLAGGCITVFIPFVISYFIRPKTIEYQKSFQPYECGVDPFKQMWDYRFGISYYLYALIFLAFDVDVLYLFPIGTIYNTDKIGAVRGISEIFIFIGILSLAIIYAWVKGVFKWERKTVK